MGTDNLFHKKRERGIRDLKRKTAQRSSYDRVLIVCEGEKTEPNYFNELIRDKKLNTANVVVEDSRHGSDPMSVVNCALSRDPKGTELNMIGFFVFLTGIVIQSMMLPWIKLSSIVLGSRASL